MIDETIPHDEDSSDDQIPIRKDEVGSCIVEGMLFKFSAVSLIIIL